jgi:hypothetical protein
MSLLNKVNKNCEVFVLLLHNIVYMSHMYSCVIHIQNTSRWSVRAFVHPNTHTHTHVFINIIHGSNIGRSNDFPDSDVGTFFQSL